MDRIRARKIYLDYLDSLNESKSREKKINKTVKRINNFLNNELIINWLIKKVVSVDSSDGVKYLVWFADRVKNYILDYVEGYFRGTDQVYFNDEASESFRKSMELYLKHGEMTDEIVKIITELYEIEKTKFKEDEDTNLLYAWFEYSAGKNLKKNIENELDQFLLRSQDWLESEEPITTIVDWLKTPLRADEETDLSQYKTYADAWNVAEEWHKNLKAGGIIEDESGYIFKIYDDGWYWIDLQTTISDDEAEAMGHCRTTNEGTTLLSLRKNKSPHVTMAINSEDGSVTQCKGKNNKKPVEKYHKYIVDLLTSRKQFVLDHFMLEYDTGDDFHPDDLSPELYKKLIKNSTGWLDSNFDVSTFYNNFRDDLDILKKMSPEITLKIALDLMDNDFVDEETGDVVTVDKGDIEEVIKYLDGAYIGIDGNKTEIKGDRWYIERSDKFLNIDFISANTKHPDRTLENSQFEWLVAKYIQDLIVFDRYDRINPYYESFVVTNNLNKATVFNDDMMKLSKMPGFGKRIKELALEYDKNIHIPKLKEIEKEYIKYLEKFDIKDIKRDQNKNLSFTVGLKEILKRAINYQNSNYSKIETALDIISHWRINLKDYVKKHNFIMDYDVITDFNNYVLENFNQEPLNESMGVAKDIKPWYDLIYEIMTVQTQGFVEAVKNNPEQFSLTLEYDGRDIPVYSAEIRIPHDAVNDLIEKRIPKNNLLQLRDLDVTYSITILPEQDFTNYLFASDAYYDDYEAEFDGKVLRKSEIYLELYLPDSILEEDEDFYRTLNDFDINDKLRQSISHEVDHAFEFFNRRMSGEEIFPEKVLNEIQQTMKNDPFTNVSNDFVDFLSLCYLALTFEASARVTEIHYYLKERPVKSVEDFWYYVKDTTAWQEFSYLKEFDSRKFYENFSFNINDVELAEALLEMGLATEEELKEKPIKDLVIRHWLKKFDNVIDKVNKKYKLKMKRITKRMFNNPNAFFKIYETKFKKSWKYFYERIVKMSAKY